MRSILSVLFSFLFLNLSPLLIPSVLHRGGFMSPTSASHPVDADEDDDEGEERQAPQEEGEHLLNGGHVLVVRSWNEECSIMIGKPLLSWKLIICHPISPVFGVRVDDSSCRDVRLSHTKNRFPSLCVLKTTAAL